MACIMALVLCNSYYLPVYFQAVKNVSPILSGVYMLPGILFQLVFAVMSGLLSMSIPFLLDYLELTILQLAGSVIISPGLSSVE